MSAPDYLSGTPPTTPGTGNSSGEALFTAGLIDVALHACHVQSVCVLASNNPQTWCYKISIPLGLGAKKIEQLEDAIALAAGSESARIVRVPGGRVLVEIPKPISQRQILRGERLERLAPPNALTVAIGVDTSGRVVWLDLTDERNAHLAIGGVTGSGKTELLRWVLFRLVRQNPADRLKLILIDPKRGELKPFERLPHLLHPIVYDPLEAVSVLAWATQELSRRAATGQSKPRIVIVVEEVADLSTTTGILPALARIAQIGRTLGMTAIVSTQQPGKQSLGDSLANYPCRIVGRIASSTLVLGATGRKRTGADELLGRGDLMMIAAGQTTRFQAPLTSPDLWAKLPVGDPGNLSADLPHLASFADLQRDARGGRGRRDLSEADYSAIEDAIENGASVDELQNLFAIGYERAARITKNLRGGG